MQSGIQLASNYSISIMKFLFLTVIAHLGLAWGLPSEAHGQALYVPCTSDTCSSGIFNTAFCCERSLLGAVSECQIPLIPLSDKNFQDQCAFIKKKPVCCIAPALLAAPTLCIPLPA
ncbi:hypothetical protein F4808DRAFT_439359 [Astrocystis sublimbata]|nr:hypothetical protein F4808DRAFT_439359 [Astrocystis sublimbata]